MREVLYLISSLITHHLSLLLWLSEARAVLGRREERFDHLRAPVVAVKTVELCEPEVEARGVGRAPQIAEVFHRDECRVELALLKGFLVDYLEQHARTRLAVS